MTYGTQNSRGWACCLTVLASLLWPCAGVAFTPQQKPREDIVAVPAIGDGLCVHNLFQSNMVLQRDKPIRIWGWAAVGKLVEVEFAGKKQEAVAEEDRRGQVGRWQVELPAQAASTEPQSMTIRCQAETLVLENILIGDVWLLGGQSNMEHPLSRIENGQLEIVSANYPEIRILTIPAKHGPDPRAGFARLEEWSDWFGQHFRKGHWDVCQPDSVRELSAIGFVFARRLHTATQIPIGVIDASRGGTTVETWTPDPMLRQLQTAEVKSLLADWDQRISDWDAQADLDQRIRQHEQRLNRLREQGQEVPKDPPPADLRPGPAMDHNRPGSCYAGMIAPIAGLPIKGAIFHQGYNNCFNGTQGALMYRAVFPEMIRAWRAAFNDPELPFGVLSLCTEGAVQTRENYSEMMHNVGPYIREAQYQTFVDLLQQGDQQIGFVSTYDLRRRWYHPQLKIPAGERIARWALATQYGFERETPWKPPMLESMKIEDGKITLRFDARVGAVDDGSTIQGFAIAGEDRRFHPADANYLVTGKDDRGRPREDRQSLVLSSEMVSDPVHFRYAWGRSPLANLQVQGHWDIPVATQRSDDWPLEDIPRGIFGENPPAKLERGQRQQIIRALRQQDLRRRVFEADRLLREHGTLLQESEAAGNK